MYQDAQPRGNVDQWGQIWPLGSNIMTGVRYTVVKYDSWGQKYKHWGQIWPALIGIQKNECSIIMDVQPTCDPNMVICFMKCQKQSIYVRTVRSQILFNIGTVNSFLASMDKNQVYAAHYSARTTHEPV